MAAILNSVFPQGTRETYPVIRSAIWEYEEFQLAKTPYSQMADTREKTGA